jgi:hypothetical protein
LTRTIATVYEESNWSINWSIFSFSQQSQSELNNSNTPRANSSKDTDSAKIARAKKAATDALNKSNCRKLFEKAGLVLSSKKIDPQRSDLGLSSAGLEMQDSNPAGFLGKVAIIFRPMDQAVLKANPSSAWNAHSVLDSNDVFYLADGKKYTLGETILVSESFTQQDPRSSIIYTSATSMADRSNISIDQARGLVVLHELMHLILKTGHNGPGSTDGEWNDKIRANCF